MSLFEDTYYTIEKPSTGVYRDKGSKFIAYLLPFNDEATLKDALARVKSEHPKARHWCYAYRLTTDPSVFRVNDDGEPSGSAGRPILNCLLSKELTNALVVVVRYFGGTLLGIPGLIQAYKSSTLAAIEQADIIQKRLEEVYQITFTYAQMNDIMRLVKQDQLQVVHQEFEATCAIALKIPKARVTEILNRIQTIPDIKVRFLRGD